MQQKHSNKKLVKPAEYARLANLNRSTVSRQIARGVIPTHDGMIDPKEADLARAANVSTRRPPIAEKAHPEFYLGVGYLAEHLRGAMPALHQLAVDLGIPRDRAGEFVRAAVCVVNLWAAELIGSGFGAKSRKAFESELGKWAGYVPKAGK